MTYELLLGATTYRVMSQMSSEAAEGQGEYRPDEAESLTGLDAVPKVVFSSTLTEPLAWPNTRLVSTDPVEAVRAMKREGSTPMRTLGSLTLCRSLLAAGLVDRFRLVVFPVVTGATGQERVYDGYPDVALRAGREPHLRRPVAAARVRTHRAGGPAGRRLSRGTVGAMSLRRVDRAVADYTALRPRLLPATDEFVDLITGTIDDAGINYLSVTGRTKTIGSFAAKARGVLAADNAADPLRGVTDQVGVRVITYVQRDIDAVAGLLAEQFTVLDDRDLGEETAAAGRFGYASRHLLVSRAPGEPTAYDPLFCASIQLRTVLQHAWAEFEHDIRYKGTVPPEQVPDLDRRFTLAAGLLELADKEFEAIRDRLQVGLGDSDVDGGDEHDPRISSQELATFLAGRYSSAGWSRTEHYEWISGLLLELGIASLDELSSTLRDVDSAAVTAAWTTATRPGRCGGSTTTCSRGSATPTSRCTATRTAASRWSPAARTCPAERASERRDLRRRRQRAVT